jgi:hypothetical protein
MASFGDLAVTFFSEPFGATGPGGSAATSAEVPGVFHVAIGGHGYMLDLKTNQYGWDSIPYLRPFAVSADSLGEKNINPESLWRASQNTWHHGAGQTHLDRSDSDPSRFRSSKGLCVWNKWKLSLLPDTSRVRVSANTNLKLAVAGGYLYLADGNATVFTTNLSAYTTVAGTPAAAVTGIASDGNTVYIAYTGAGVYTTTRGAVGAATQLVTSAVTPSAIGYVKGRLMVASGRSVYNVTATTPGVLPTALYDHPNTDFTWVGFAEGAAAIYAAGYSGDKTLIYRTSIKSDGTGLDAMIPAGQLPDGEVVRSIGAYLGFVVIGTDKGFRLGVPASSGDLNFGALVELNAPVRCTEGQGRYIWFGWDNYDTTSTGLGRMDLAAFTDNLVPAYASDLMATTQGSTLDVATFGDKRVFTVSGVGLYTETTNLVTSGSLRSGLISYDLPDQKVALYLDVRHQEPLAGTHNAYLSVDEGEFLIVGGHAEGDAESTFTIPEYEGETFEIQHTLLVSGTDPTAGPVLYRHTLLVNPAVASGYTITVPLLLSDTVRTAAGSSRKQDPNTELAFLRGLRDRGQRVIYQEPDAVSVTVEDIAWRPTTRTHDKTGWNGTCVVKLKTI